MECLVYVECQTPLAETNSVRPGPTKNCSAGALGQQKNCLDNGGYPPSKSGPATILLVNQWTWCGRSTSPLGRVESSGVQKVEDCIGFVVRPGPEGPLGSFSARWLHTRVHQANGLPPDHCRTGVSSFVPKSVPDLKPSWHTYLIMSDLESIFGQYFLPIN